MARIGAEYHLPSDLHSAALTDARAVFLRRVEQHAPEVLRSLREDVLPVYRHTWANPDLQTRVGRQWWDRNAASWHLIIDMVEQGQAGYEGLVPLLHALQEWRDRFSLADDWLLSDALETLYTWTCVPGHLDSAPDEFIQHDDDGGVWEPIVAPAAFSLPECLPTLETWAAYEKRARRAFDAVLREYRRSVDAYAKAAGLVASTEKRNRTGGDPFKHFDWLVRFQVQRWTHKKIAGHYRTTAGHAYTEKTVASAIRRTAESIGLTRRSV